MNSKAHAPKEMTIPTPEVIKNEIGNAERVCLFGMGALLKDCYGQIVFYLGREPDFICDNGREKWGIEFFGKKCISPSELADNRDRTVVIITVKNYEGIFDQLRGMGIRNVFIACYERRYNSIYAVKRLERDKSYSLVHSPFTPHLEGKWTLITGASRGVGRQIALGMAKLGSNIILHSRTVSHLKEVVDACSGCGVQVLPVAADLSDLGELEAMFSRIEQAVPQVDIIFNNAGVSPPCHPSEFWSVSDQDYMTSFTVNTIAPIRICYRIIPRMIEKGFGRVINITSSIQKRPAEMAYACSKAALDKFVHDIAPSLRETGVMISLVDPGWLRTDMGGPRAPHAVESVVPGVLLGAVLEGDVNGLWLSAQDYAGLSLSEAVEKVKFIYPSFLDGDSESHAEIRIRRPHDL